MSIEIFDGLNDLVLDSLINKSYKQISYYDFQYNNVSF